MARILAKKGEFGGAKSTKDEVYVSKAELLAELDRRKNGSLKYLKEIPTIKQQEFLSRDDVTEIFYGGSVAGGKSSAILMSALRYVHVPRYSALILKRSFRDLSLPGAIMDRARQWLIGTDAKWSELDKTFTFPTGATLTFGFVDNENDQYRYQGAEFQFIGIDELCQWPERWYKYLFSRLRKTDTLKVPLRMRSTGNPGGVGTEWVRRRFIDATTRERSSLFIKSTLDDNPHVDKEAYLKTLANLDPFVRKQLVEGLWVVDSNRLVYKFDPLKNVSQPVKCHYHILAIDYGYVDSAAFCVLGWRDNDPVTYVVESFKRNEVYPSQAAQIVKDLDEHYKFSRIIADVGGLGKGYAEEARQRFNLPIEPAEKNNKRGYIDLANGALFDGAVKFIEGRNEALIDEMDKLPWVEDRSKESDGFDNHLCDAFLYGWRASKAFAERPIMTKIQTRAEIEEAEIERIMERRETVRDAVPEWKNWWGEDGIS